MSRPLVVIVFSGHTQNLPAVAAEVGRYFDDVILIGTGHAHCAVPVTAHASGKGNAIMRGAEYARQKGFTHIITIDADGYYCPEDLVRIAGEANKNTYSIITGCRDFSTENVPLFDRFERRFASFWARMQTGKKINDIQSGLCAYPVIIFDCLKLRGKRVSFYTEIAVKAAWAGFDIDEVAVRVRWPARKERVFHCGKLIDECQIVLLNTLLTIRALLPVPHKKFVRGKDDRIISLNPFRVLREEMKRRENPRLLGVSAAWSVFWGSLALPGVRAMCLLAGVGYFDLNRPIALTMDKLALLPLVPAVCVEVGFFIRYGVWLTELSVTTLADQAGQRIWEWFLGSLVVAPVCAAIAGCTVYSISILIRKGMLLHDKQME
ncbi:MAG: glycosyltransferase [Spirochaetota bacterium]|nr:glycosyltransferase [Spirochaetota bacterium]